MASSPTTLPRFSSDLERKHYAGGMQIVRSRLAGNQKPTAQQLHEFHIAEGKRIIAKKLAVADRGRLSPITQSAPPDNHLLGFKVHHLRM